ncbi:hypothetical protein Tco_0405436 [Tanacetum coccineum]
MDTKLTKDEEGEVVDSTKYRAMIGNQIQGANVEGEEMDKEETNEEDEANDIYRDVNVNLEGRDTEMTDAPRTIIQTTQIVPDTTVADAELLLSTITHPPQPTPPHQPSATNTTISSILEIVDTYLANKMSEAVKTTIQLQSDRLRDEAQAENEDFINKLDDNIKKIIKDQIKEQVKAQVSKILLKIEKTVNEQLEAEVLTRSSNESKTSHIVAANLFELELKKILIDKMEINKSIHRSDEQKNIYKALVDAYESDKLILDTYGDNVLFKRRRYYEDKDEEPPLDQTGGPIEKELEKNQSQPVHQRKRPPRQLASQLKGPNLITSKLTNLTIEEFLAFNVSLRMFTRSIVIHRRVKDLELGVESYQKKFNLTKPDTYISDLKRREAYSAYSNPRGFIYQNKDKKNRLMRIDELHKFSDGTLNDVQTALNDRLKGIRIKYLPQTIWR